MTKDEALLKAAGYVERNCPTLVFDEIQKAQPNAEWVGLTDDEMHQCFDVSGRREPVYRALEAALKEKNT